MSFIIGRKRGSTFSEDVDPNHFVGKRMSELFRNYGSPFPPICGFMHKRGRWNKQYKKRWFVWHEEQQALVYAAGPQPKEKCKGIIHINNDCYVDQDEEASKDGTCFRINCPHRIFYLRVADPTEAASWMLTISQLIKEYTERVEEEKKRQEAEAAEKLRLKQEEALEFHEKMKAQGHELSGIAKLLKFNKELAPVATDIEKMKEEEQVKPNDKNDKKEDDDDDDDEDEGSDEPKIRMHIDDTKLASDGNEGIDITHATDDEISKNVLQLPGAIVPMARDRHAYRGKSLSMKPMQALRLSRTRRLSGAVSGEGFYSSKNAKISAEKLKEINDRWKHTHAGVDDKKDDESSKKGEKKTKLKFGKVQIMVDDDNDGDDKKKKAPKKKRLSLSWGADTAAKVTNTSKSKESSVKSPKKLTKRKKKPSTSNIKSSKRGSNTTTTTTTPTPKKTTSKSSTTASNRKKRTPAVAPPPADALREQISERMLKGLSSKEKARARRERGNRAKEEDREDLAHLEAAAVMEDSIELKYINKDMGFGIFAKRDMVENEAVFVEKNILGVQNADNDCLLCAHCMKFLGNLDDIFQLLGHLKNKPSLKFTKGVHVPAPDAVPCKRKCGELYCSNECRFIAWNQHHQLLCSADRQNGKLLKAFYDHSKASENERFILAAKVIASIIITMRRQKCDLETASKPFASFSRDLWWETVPPPDDLDMEEARIFTQLLINMCTSSLQLLKRALRTHKKYQKLFTLKFYGELLGMFEMNNWGMRSRNPLHGYVTHIQNDLTPEKQDKVKKALGRDYTHLDRCANVVGEGSGLYELGGRLNHSCMPNVVLSKTENCDDDMSVVVTSRSIYKGEELTMSYVNQKDSFANRRKALSYYGFECKCQKCLKDEMMLKLSRPKITFYFSSVSGNRQVKKETQDLQHMLDARKCEYELIDVSLEENYHHRENMEKGSGKNTLPQVFVDGVYRGSYAEFHQANEMEAGFHRFLYCGPLRRLSFYNPKFFSIYHNLDDELSDSDISENDDENAPDNDDDDDDDDDDEQLQDEEEPEED